MREWVLSVCGIVILTAILYMILPSDKFSKIIKSIFALMCLSVLIKPVFVLKNSDFDLKDIFISKEITFQNDYLDFTLKQKEFSLENEIYSILVQSGIKCKNVDVELKYDDDLSISTKKVLIHIDRTVINKNYENIVIVDKVFECLSFHVSADKNLIEIYE